LTNLFAKHQPRAVINFAAESYVDRSIHGSGEFTQINIVGTFCLLEDVLAYWFGLPGVDHQNGRFMHVATDEVYDTLAKNGYGQYLQRLLNEGVKA